jgi:DNA-binding transcriptional MerR regulator
MKKAMFLREELLLKAGISAEILAQWEAVGLVKAAGKTKEQMRFYTHDTLVRIEHIQSFMKLGYQSEHILRIIKKIGLPRGAGEQEKTDKLHRYFTVGDLAERGGISPRTIKHWEDKGIIEPDMRSQGGFRLYSETYVYVCQLIKDLQLFGYSLNEIKTVSDLFRDYLTISRDIATYPPDDTRRRLEGMTRKVGDLQNKMDLFKTGIERWETLLKKKKKELAAFKALNTKRQGSKRTKTHAQNRSD